MGRVVCALGGLVFLAMALGGLVQPGRARRRYDRAVPAVGRVVDVGIEEYAEGTVHQPVLEFDSGTGTVTTAVLVPEYVGERLAEGDEVRIRYDPRNPAEAWLDGHEPQGSVLGVLFLLLFSVSAFVAAFR